MGSLGLHVRDMGVLEMTLRMQVSKLGGFRYSIHCNGGLVWDTGFEGLFLGRSLPCFTFFCVFCRSFSTAPWISLVLSRSFCRLLSGGETLLSIPFVSPLLPTISTLFFRIYGYYCLFLTHLTELIWFFTRYTNRNLSLLWVGA